MAKNNPFTIAFGKQPPQFISRFEQTGTILDAFTADIPTSQVYMLTGVRGSGKTVLLTSISKKLREQEDWIVVELNPESDLLLGLASKLYSLPELQPLFIKAKLDLSLFGIGLSIEKSSPIANIESAIDRMLSVLDNKKKKLLIEIDEVTNNEFMKTFAAAFQIFMRQDHEIFLIMTGLYQNIYNLQNEKSLTFLYRAPKIILNPLNIGAIIRSYKEIFNIDHEEASKMANITMGYPFAFQVLGYLKWENSAKSLDELIPTYDQYLDEYIYDKIFSELSPTEKDVLLAIAEKSPSPIKVKDIREKLDMSSSLFSSYRDKIEKKGLIDTSQYGYIRFILPRFDRYIKEHMW